MTKVFSAFGPSWEPTPAKANRFDENGTVAKTQVFAWTYSPMTIKGWEEPQRVIDSPHFICGGLIWKFGVEPSAQRADEVNISITTFGSQEARAPSVKTHFIVKCGIHTTSYNRTFLPNSTTRTPLFFSQISRGDIHLSLKVKIYGRARADNYPFNRVRHGGVAVQCATMHMLFHIGCLRKAILDLTPLELKDRRVEAINNLFRSLRFTSKKYYILWFLQRLRWADCISSLIGLHELQYDQMLNRSLEDRVVSVLQHTRVAEVIDNTFTICCRDFVQNLATGYEESSCRSVTSLSLSLNDEQSLHRLILSHSRIDTAEARSGFWFLSLPPVLRIYLDRPSKFVNGTMPLLRYPHLIDLAQFSDPSTLTDPGCLYELQAVTAQSCQTGYFHQAFIRPAAGNEWLNYKGDAITVQVDSDEMLEENMRGEGLDQSDREECYASMLVYIRRRDAFDIMSDGTGEDISKLLSQS